MKHRMLTVVLVAISFLAIEQTVNAQATRIRMGGLFSGVRVKAGYGANVNASPCGVNVGWGGCGPTGACGFNSCAPHCGPTNFCATPMCAQPTCSPCGPQAMVNVGACGTSVYSPCGPTAVNVGAGGCGAATQVMPQGMPVYYMPQTFAY